MFEAEPFDATCKTTISVNSPPQLGLFTKLTSLVLEGNPLRSVRRDLLEKGTVALMKFLRERLPQDEQQQQQGLRQDVSAQQAKEASDAIAVRQQDPLQRCVPQYASGAKPDDRPFATQFNTKNAAPPVEAVQQLDKQCVRIGERSGTTWDISHRAAASGSSSAFPSRGGGGGSTALLLPPTVDLRLNCSELHSSTDATFRQNVSILRCNRQVQMEVLSLSFLFTFPSMKELYLGGCRRLTALRAGDERQEEGRSPHDNTARDHLDLSGLDTVDEA